MFFDCSIFAVLFESFVDRVPCHANVRRCKKLAVFMWAGELVQRPSLGKRIIVV